jgi:uncharacterized RDD family membrane protein YckC
MRSPQGTVRFVTPEAVSISADVAGLGSRMIAILIDSAIQMALLILIGLALAGLGLNDTAAAAAVVGGIIFLYLGYFFLFEGLWAGRTPGKRAQRIRVVRADGQPAGWTQVGIRTLLRLVDILPTAYAIGSIAILLTARSQRLGDLAAATLVVRERPAPLPMPVYVSPAGATAGVLLDTTAVSPELYSAIRSFMERRGALVAGARDQLATQFADLARRHVGGAGDWIGSNEGLLEAVVTSYRARYRPAIPDLPAPPPM